MRTSCLAVLLVASFADAADPPAKSSSELGELLTKQGYTAVPLTRTTDDGGFLVRVKLDGQAFTLFLDTGASDAFNLTKAAGKLLGNRSRPLGQQ